MVDAERDTVAAKGILKRRVLNVVPAESPPSGCDDCYCGDVGKRYVRFDETITVKNDKDLVVTKPLKLELVIENWKSNNVKTPPEVIQPDPGIVRRLVDEYNTIENPYNADNVDIAEIDFPPSKDDNDKDNESTMAIQSDIPLCRALETVNLTRTAYIE